MITIKHFLLPATVLALCISGAAIAKQPDHGKKYDKSSGSDARLLNSNKQSKTGDNLRGGDRADERHDINESREHDNSGGGADARKDQKPKHKR